VEIRVRLPGGDDEAVEAVDLGEVDEGASPPFQGPKLAETAACPTSILPDDTSRGANLPSPSGWYVPVSLPSREASAMVAIRGL
jgi:hypothetical protein